MTDHRVTAQLTMLASDLGVDMDQLASLSRLDAAYLHGLRGAVSAYLCDAHAPVFRRVSRLAPLVPNSLVAKLVPSLVPPLVSGSAAGALALDHADRIDDLLPRFPASYLAACAPYLDLRVVARIAPTITPEIIVPAARQLLADGDYATAAAFVDFATPELIDAIERGIDDDHAILMTSTFVYSDDVLDQIANRLPPDRLRILVVAALSDPATVGAGLSFAARVSETTRARIVDLVRDDLDESILANIQSVVQQAEAEPVLVEVGRELIATAPERQDEQR